MLREEIVNYITHSDIFKKWHWFRWHFQPYLFNMEHAFAKAIVDALLVIDNKIQDYAINTIQRMASEAIR